MERLADHIDLLTGFPFKSASYTSDGGGTRLVRGDNVVQGQLRWDNVARWSEGEQNGIERYRLEPGDVVLAMDRPWIEAGLKYARIGRDDVPSLLVQRVARLRALSDLHQGFLFYLIGSRSFTDHVLAVQTGTAVPHISGKQILEFQFRLPSWSEQEAIAAVLGALDDKIEQNRKTAAALERLARAIFKAWFVDFEPVKAKAAGAKSFPSMPQEAFDSLPTTFTDSELGPVPEGWEVNPLGDVCEINARSVAKGEIDGEIEYVDIASVSVGQLDQVQRVPFAEAPSRARRRIRHGDTIWSCVRPNRRSYLFIHSPPPNRIVSTGFAVLSPTKLGPAYLYHTVVRPEFVEYLVANADGSAYPAVRADHFAKAQILIPTRLVTVSFDSIAMPMRDWVASADRESRSLAELRDLLLPKLLAGEVHVAETKRLPEEVAS